MSTTGMNMTITGMNISITGMKMSISRMNMSITRMNNTPSRLPSYPHFFHHLIKSINIDDLDANDRRCACCLSDYGEREEVERDIATLKLLAELPLSRNPNIARVKMPAEYPVRLPCGHHFGSKCIVPIFQNGMVNKCPMCRRVCFIRPIRSMQLSVPVNSLQGKLREYFAMKVNPRFCLREELPRGQYVMVYEKWMRPHMSRIIERLVGRAFKEGKVFEGRTSCKKYIEHRYVSDLKKCFSEYISSEDHRIFSVRSLYIDLSDKIRDHFSNFLLGELSRKTTLRIIKMCILYFVVESAYLQSFIHHKYWRWMERTGSTLRQLAQENIEVPDCNDSGCHDLINH
ncbi:hypothetical protein M501DRAFT_1014024 [Patellaria atrata CBS 101060]|uniref:RING-type domain-containing protein n=1 Tax=Patellaria atrata CBS 101060 TaxID=1346257 RepID=A0A9P4VV29_9PEZI|nr:hypothetical protein M501DRAFT_1014024 [Patellaria atrata CBS 101060]